MIVCVYYKIFFNWYVERNLITRKITLMYIPKCWRKTFEEWKKLEDQTLPF